MIRFWCVSVRSWQAQRLAREPLGDLVGHLFGEDGATVFAQNLAHGCFDHVSLTPLVIQGDNPFEARSKGTHRGSSVGQCLMGKFGNILRLERRIPVFSLLSFAKWIYNVATLKWRPVIRLGELERVNNVSEELYNAFYRFSPRPIKIA